MQIHTINTGYFKLDGGAMFGVVPKSIWNRLNPADENNLCTWAMRCLLVEMEGRLILIDSGLGDKQSEKFFSYYEPFGEDSLDKSLKALGVSNDDITDVFNTHFHFDHCGGAIIRNENGVLEPAFKNAIYWSNQKHWDWAVNPNERRKASFLTENIMPMQESGQLKLAEDGEELYPGFKVHFVYGHTEAMMLPIIKYGDQTIAYMADLIPSASHLGLPYIMGYDIRPMQTLAEKISFLDEAINNDYILFFEHDRTEECGKLVKKNGKIRVESTFALKDLS